MTSAVVNPKTLMAPLFHLELVRDRDIPYKENVKTTEAAAEVLHQLLDNAATEKMVVLYLNSGAEVVGAEQVGQGGLEMVSAGPSEIFRGALLAGVPEIMLSHNHLDGNVRPSLADIKFTMTLISMAGLLGLRVRDHIVVGPGNKHISLRENMNGSLHEDFAKAEQELYGSLPYGSPFGGGATPHGIDRLKELILGAINGKDAPRVIDVPMNGLDFTGKKNKKGGDPSANAVSDLENSLSYMWLTKVSK